MPAEPSALGRIGILVLAAAGPTARYGGWTLPGGKVEEGETIEAAQALIVAVIVIHIIGSLVPIIAKSAQPRHREPDNWFERRSWSEIALLASWAPFAFPLLGLWRVGRWVWTGE
jgi:hypothetical protein